MTLFLTSGILSQDYEPGKRFSNWFFNDPVSLTNDFTATNWVAIGYTGIALGGLTNFDQANSSFVRKRYYRSDFLKTTNEFGTFKIVAPASAAIFGATLLIKITNCRMLLSLLSRR